MAVKGRYSSKKKQAQENLQKKMEQLFSVEAQLKELDVDISKAEIKLKGKKAKLAQLQKEIAAVDIKITETKTTLTQARVQYAKQVEQVKRVEAANKEIQIKKYDILADNYEANKKEKNESEEEKTTRQNEYKAEEHYAAIKRYKELVKEGFIKEDRITDKYEMFDFLESIESDTEKNARKITAISKGEELRAKAKKEEEEHRQKIMAMRAAWADL